MSHLINPADALIPSDLQAVLDQVPEAYIVHDENGRVIAMNQIARHLLGQSDGNSGALSVLDFDAGALSELGTVWQNAAEQGTRHTIERILRRRSGEAFPAKVVVSAVRSAGKTLIVMRIQDISFLDGREQMLQLAKYALDHAANPTFWYKTSNTQFVYVNDAACEYLGYSREELLQMNLWDINPSTKKSELDDRLARMRAGNSVLLETEHRKKNGEMVPVEALVRLIEFDGEEYVISFVRDVTRRKKYERDLKEARERAERADAAKSQFLANMSHEIRTPLTAIIGYGEYLMESAVPEQERDRAVKTVVQTGYHLLQIINDILDVSKIEADRLDVACEPLSVPELLHQVCALPLLKTAEKGLSFDVVAEGWVPTTIVSDSLRLKQILFNLLSNAVKFTNRGGVTLRVRCDRERSRLTIAVEDTGIGISANDLEKLFSPFVQADLTTTRRFGGTGLGLYLSRRLAERLGGSIDVRSEVGTGSIFEVYVATGSLDKISGIDSLADICAREKSEPAALDVAVTGSVLLVEDSIDNREILSLYLRKFGATVRVAVNGQEAMDAALASPFDLILMDIQMPIMDGLTATRLLRERGYTRPIVALTANALADDVGRCLAAGCNDHLAKPINRKQFAERIRKYLSPAPTAT